MAKNVEVISGRKILLGTSLEVVAVKRASEKNAAESIT